MVHFMRRGFESHTYLQFTPAKPDSFRAECPLGSCTNIPRQSTSSSPLQSGPKSPPTCSRVGLAWVRHATSPNLLQRRSASRGGSRFNVGQSKAYPEFIQNLRSVAQAEAAGGVSPYPIPPPCLATDRLDIGYLEPVSCGYRIPPLRPFYQEE